MKEYALLAALCLLTVSCEGLPGRDVTPSPAATLTLASWNMEHLAERNDSGCRPRTDADYAAMRAYADALAADVIALQEVESKAAAERVEEQRRAPGVVHHHAGPLTMRRRCDGGNVLDFEGFRAR